MIQIFEDLQKMYTVSTCRLSVRDSETCWEKEAKFVIMEPIGKKPFCSGPSWGIRLPFIFRARNFSKTLEMLHRIDMGN